MTLCACNETELRSHRPSEGNEDVDGYLDEVEADIIKDEGGEVTLSETTVTVPPNIAKEDFRIRLRRWPEPVVTGTLLNFEPATEEFITIEVFNENSYDIASADTFSDVYTLAQKTTPVAGKKTLFAVVGNYESNHKDEQLIIPARQSEATLALIGDNISTLELASTNVMVWAVNVNTAKATIEITKKVNGSVAKGEIATAPPPTRFRLVYEKMDDSALGVFVGKTFEAKFENDTWGPSAVVLDAFGTQSQGWYSGHEGTVAHLNAQGKVELLHLFGDSNMMSNEKNVDASFFKNEFGIMERKVMMNKVPSKWFFGPYLADFDLDDYPVVLYGKYIGQRDSGPSMERSFNPTTNQFEDNPFTFYGTDGAVHHTAGNHILRIDQFGDRHIVYNEYQSGFFYSKSSGKDWSNVESTAVRFSNDSCTGNTSLGDIAIDSRGVPHIIYHCRDSGSKIRVYYATIKDGVPFHRFLKITNIYYTRTLIRHILQIHAGKDDRIYAALTDGNGQIGIAAGDFSMLPQTSKIVVFSDLDNEGGGTENTLEIASDKTSIYDIRLASSIDGRLHIATIFEQYADNQGQNDYEFQIKLGYLENGQFTLNDFEEKIDTGSQWKGRGYRLLEIFDER